MREIRNRKAASTGTSCSDNDFTSYSLKVLNLQCVPTQQLHVQGYQ